VATGAAAHPPADSSGRSAAPGLFADLLRQRGADTPAAQAAQAGTAASPRSVATAPPTLQTLTGMRAPTALAHGAEPGLTAQPPSAGAGEQAARDATPHKLDDDEPARSAGAAEARGTEARGTERRDSERRASDSRAAAGRVQQQRASATRESQRSAERQDQARHASASADQRRLQQGEREQQHVQPGDATHTAAAQPDASRRLDEASASTVASAGTEASASAKASASSESSACTAASTTNLPPTSAAPPQSTAQAAAGQVDTSARVGPNQGSADADTGVESTVALRQAGPAGGSALRGVGRPDAGGAGGPGGTGGLMTGRAAAGTSSGPSAGESAALRGASGRGGVADGAGPASGGTQSAGLTQAGTDNAASGLVAGGRAEPQAAGPGAAGTEPGASFAALLAGSSATSPEQPAAVAAPSLATPVEVPVEQPGFGAAVMMKVGALAADGVQQATLTLNPAELGPIQVRIAMEGQQATIDFGAAHGHTRELLEAALSSLATALQGDGLHLASARVSDWPKAQLPDPATTPWPGAPQDGSGSAAHAGAGQDGQPGQGSPGQHPAAGWPPGSERAQRLAGLGWGRAGAAAEASAGPSGGSRLGLDLYA
jgi:flagellar hook-length control protein FliK